MPWPANGTQDGSLIGKERRLVRDDGAVPASQSVAPIAGFNDDADTVPQCTGACCDPVTLPISTYREMSLDPRHIRNARYVLNMLTARGPLPDHGTAEFDCKYFDRGTRRCTAYDRRPEMCRTFPDGPVCHMCGGRFATGEHPEAAAQPSMSAAERARLAATRALIAGERGGSSKRDRKRRR